MVEFLACDGVPSTLKSAVYIPGPVYLTVGVEVVADVGFGLLPSPLDLANVQL